VFSFVTFEPRGPALVALCLFLTAAVPWPPMEPAAHAAVLPPARGKQGAVAADHPVASKAGLSILESGGNAVDAACATVFALGVVQPAGSGLGGGGFMLIKPADAAETVALDFREVAPKAATRNLFAGKPRRAASQGGLAVGVPSELIGCARAVERFGKLSLRQVLAPAIALATRGFSLGSYLDHVLQRKKKLMLESPMFAQIFARKKQVSIDAGERIHRPRLGATLRAIARQGEKAFYSGKIAREIVKTVREAGGILTLEDLAAAAPKWRTPLRLGFAGYEIHMMPPPSSGGVVFTQVLNILRRYDLARLGHNSSRYLHRLTEATKHAFADRARFLGDADFVRLPLPKLLSQAYANDLANRIGQRTARTASYGSSKTPRAPTSDGGTTHISVVDSNGMGVALTSSINTGFGSKLVTPESGIILNNTMADFATHPGKPNVFGLIQGRANAVGAGKRPLSSMSPTIVTRNGQFVAALGGSGGPTIITATLQALLNLLVFELNAAQAVSRSRFHHQWLPDTLWLEEDLPLDVVFNLRKRGHTIKRVTRPPLPHTAVQLVHASGGVFTAASDPRKYGAAAAY
jgi:gamma-glutamyltranspeptidase/glutathione hydrolase